ncbi:alpha/beta fold hydrolase [Pseudodesulfovibrio karagichevae]|uniref:Alpha/beta fold hydrolase n=1 Tax=Pseudodesulfovibrio karagichevae TaxID=3239305 RepID=A0ABV4JYX8_9BACT
MPTNTSTNDRPGIVLFVHGALADERVWQEHIGLFRGEQEASAVTLRHFGVHGDRDQGEFGLNTHADDLAGELARLAVHGPVHVVAWSYGADVALNAVVRHPGRAASLLVYEPGYPGCLSEEEMHVFGRDAGAMFGPIFALVGDGLIPQAVEALVDKSAGRMGYFAAQPEAVRNQQLENGHTLRRQLHQQETPDLGVARLAEIDIPLTVAWGEDSRPLFRAVSVGVARAVPGARVHPVDRANHMLPVESPRRFVDIVRQHLGA